MKRVLIKTGKKIMEALNPNVIFGDVSGIFGDASGIRGNVSGIFGDASEIKGDLNMCELSAKDRKRRIRIEDLILS